MSSAPSVKTVDSSYSYSSSQYDDALDTYDSASSYDGAANVQTQFADNVLVDVLTILFLFVLPLLATAHK